MNNDNEIKIFLDYINNNCADAITSGFMKPYNVDMYVTISKVLNKENLSSKEKTMIKETGCTTFEPAHALMKSPNVSDEIKELIVNNLLSDEIEDLKDYTLRRLIINILTNYPNISDTHINSLFNKYFGQCLYTLSRDATPPTESVLYCDRIVAKFSQLFIDALNHKISKPSGFCKDLSPLRYVASPTIHQYIVKNMPKDIETAEFVSTELINNPFVDEKTKNILFDTYGYNYTTIKTQHIVPYVTPHIAQNLYQSAMDVMDDFHHFSHDINKEKTYNFLTFAISKNLFPEAIQIDFVNRIILEDKERGSKKSNDLLELFTYATQSPKVLHIIFEQAPHINNRDTACRNLNISHDDLQKHTEIYYNKIKKMVDKHTPEKILDKWICEIDYILEDITLQDDQYSILIHSDCYDFLNILNSHSTTPLNALQEIITVAENHIKKGNLHLWENLFLETRLHAELLKQECCNQEQLDYVTNLFHLANTHYKYHQDFNDNITMDWGLIYGNIDFYKQVVNCFRNVFDTINKDFADKIEEFLYIKLNTPNLPNHLIVDNLDKIDISKIQNRLKNNASHFKSETFDNNTFFAIKEYAHRHAIFSSAIATHSEKKLEKIADVTL